MMNTYILVGLGLVAIGIIILCVTRRKRNAKNITSPPPLPPRINTRNSASIVSQSQASVNRSTSTRALPPRQGTAPATAGTTRNTPEVVLGPRGIKPEQFPCCPYDKQRNVPGRQQVVFWDSVENCYRCSRGHQFKSNGKLL